jgi:hypothetical protein
MAVGKKGKRRMAGMAGMPGGLPPGFPDMPLK